MRLAAAPVDINVGAVVRSIEPDFDLIACLSGDTTRALTGNCRLTGVVSEALQSFMAHLDRHTLADLIAEPRGKPVSPRTISFMERRIPLEA